jgi:hypothetical protein
MDVEPSIQTIQFNGGPKEEEVDELIADPDADYDLSDVEDELEIDDPNEFRIRDALPEYKEYKRKLSEVHSRRASFLCTDNRSDYIAFSNGSFK